MTNPAPGDRLTSGILYRRIYPQPNNYDVAERRPTRQVFDLKKGDDHLSMTLRDLTSVEEMLKGHEAYGLCEMDVEALVAEGLQVSYEPSDQEGVAHVAVRGRLSGSVRHNLARRARVIKEPNFPT